MEEPYSKQYTKLGPTARALVNWLKRSINPKHPNRVTRALILEVLDVSDSSFYRLLRNSESGNSATIVRVRDSIRNLPDASTGLYRLATHIGSYDAEAEIVGVPINYSTKPIHRLADIAEMTTSREGSEQFFHDAASSLSVISDHGVVQPVLREALALFDFARQLLPPAHPELIEVGLVTARLLGILRQFDDAIEIIDALSSADRSSYSIRSATLLRQARAGILRKRPKEYKSGTLNASILKMYSDVGSPINLVPLSHRTPASYHGFLNHDVRELIMYVTNLGVSLTQTEEVKRLLQTYLPTLKRTSETVNEIGDGWQRSNAIAESRLGAVIGNAEEAIAQSDQLLKDELTAWDGMAVEYTKTLALQRIADRKSLELARERAQVLIYTAERLHHADREFMCRRLLAEIEHTECSQAPTIYLPNF